MRLAFFLQLFLIIFELPHGFAQYQQTPPQYAPQFLKYRLHSNPENYRPDLTKTGIVMEWEVHPEVEKWIVMLAKDENFEHVIAVDYALQNYAFSPKLSEGTYYYKAFGLQGHQLILETPPHELHIKKEDFAKSLPAPQEIEPTYKDLYPPKTRIRLAWTPIPKSKGYRFRIFEKSKIDKAIKNGELPHARWITIINEPWIELKDVPYSSFIYLNTDDYFWDVAAIDESIGEAGIPLYSMFYVSPDYFFELDHFNAYARMNWFPVMRTYSNSATSGAEHALSGPSYRLESSFEWWITKNWGWSPSLSITSVDLMDAGTIYTPRASLDAKFRIHTDENKSSTVLLLNAGLIFDNFVEINQLKTPSRIEKPYLLGTRIGALLRRSINQNWSFDVGVQAWMNIYAIHAQDPVYSDVSGINKNRSRLSTSVQTLLRRSFKTQWNLVAGIQLEQTALAFEPKSRDTNTILRRTGFGSFIGIEKPLSYR